MSMKSEQRQDIVERTRHVLTTMRHAASDQRSIADLDGTARDCRQISDYSSRSFDTEAELNDFFVINFYYR